MEKEKNQLVEWIKALAIAVLLAFGFRTFLFAPIIVDGQSMMPTLHHGDRMIVNKIGYTVGNLDRFDIIVFHATEKKDYIKRVIGLPGDTVEYKDDVLYINGEPLEEKYLYEFKESVKDGPLTYDFTLEEVTGLSVVPEGHYFVLGDNRRNSTDSRWIGTISEEQVLGKTNLIYWPINDVKIIK